MEPRARRLVGTADLVIGMGIERSSTVALCVSLVLHVVLVVASSRATVVSAAERVREVAPRDDWVGDTFELGTLLEPSKQDLAGSGGPGEARVAERVDESRTPATQDDTRPSAPTAGAIAPAPPAAPKPSPAHGAEQAPVGASGSAALGPTPEGSDGTASDGGRGQTGGQFGAAGRHGVRNLAAAFARAIPIANSGHPAWQTLPLGPAGSIDVEVAIDDGGTIERVAVRDPEHAPAHMRALVDRTMIMLRAGRFSLSGASVGAGEETLRLTAVLSMEDAGAPEDTPGGAFALGHRRPTLEQPGMAMFTLATGRHVEVEVRILAR